MSHHVTVWLPDGRMACADYREPVVQPMRKIHAATMAGKRPDPALFEAVGRWLDGHAEQSAVCYAGCFQTALPCGHELPVRGGGPGRLRGAGGAGDDAAG